MANELLHVQTAITGSSNYYKVLHAGAQIVNATTGALMTRNSANWPNAKIALSDSVTAGYYLASVPVGTVAKQYDELTYLQVGAAADIADPQQPPAKVLQWDGTAVAAPGGDSITITNN